MDRYSLYRDSEILVADNVIELSTEDTRRIHEVRSQGNTFVERRVSSTTDFINVKGTAREKIHKGARLYKKSESEDVSIIYLIPCIVDFITYCSDGSMNFTARLELI